MAEYINKYDSISEFVQGVAIVRKGNKFGAIMVGGKELIRPVYDTISNFDNGIAQVKFKYIKNGKTVVEVRNINLSGQIEITDGRFSFFLPEEYDWGFYHGQDLYIVIRDGKYGIIDRSNNIIIPCSYSYIEPISTHLFKFKVDGNWGLLDSGNNIKQEAKFSKIEKENESFIKVTINKSNNWPYNPEVGILNANGELIIDCVHDEITSIQIKEKSYFIAKTNLVEGVRYSTSDSKFGVFDENGILIIPQIFEEIKPIKNCFICNKCGEWHNYKRDILYSVTYSINGEQILRINNKTRIVVPAIYDFAQYANYGLVRVLKNGRWGLISRKGEEIISPQYSYIDTFADSFAIVGLSEDPYIDYSLNNQWRFKNMKYGIVDTTGEVVLSAEYDSIEKWDNGYYRVLKDGLYGLLSPSLHVVIETGKKSIRDLNNQYLIIALNSNDYYTWYGLVDYNGNTIIDATDYRKGFEAIEVIENNFLKIYYSKGNYPGTSTIAIANSRGKELCICSECDDVKYINHGLFMVTRFRYTNNDGGGHNVYNIVNINGEELFEKNYKSIDFLSDGKLLIGDNSGWGLADAIGNILSKPVYQNKLIFVDYRAEVTVKGSRETKKINTLGQVIVTNQEQEVIVPSQYYWASNFVNGISIVRSSQITGKIGVIDENFNPVIPSKYDKVSLMSDNTIKVKENECYGIYDITGRCIFPSIFYVIEYITNNRVRVVWNLNITNEWNKGKEITEIDYIKKKKDSSLDFSVNYRSAICDAQGNILKTNVGKYKGRYAMSYTDIVIENKQIRFKNVGVIDIDGNQIIPNEYDVVTLYGHDFATIKKGTCSGMANLRTKEIVMFDEIKIIQDWGIDKYGRMLFSANHYYDEENDEWITSTGAASFYGIIVKPGQYKYIHFLDNGLISVTDDNDKVGLIDNEGKIILSPIFSFISFNGEYGSVCIGGHYDNYKHIGGKWGVIDSRGTFIKECEYETEQELPQTVVNPENIKDNTLNEVPSVIMSDYIPQTSNNPFYVSHYEYYDNDNDENRGGYNGYDDQTIDEAFDGDPSLTWNID